MKFNFGLSILIPIYPLNQIFTSVNQGCQSPKQRSGRNHRFIEKIHQGQIDPVGIVGLQKRSTNAILIPKGLKIHQRQIDPEGVTCLYKRCPHDAPTPKGSHVNTMHKSQIEFFCLFVAIIQVQYFVVSMMGFSHATPSGSGIILLFVSINMRPLRGQDFRFYFGNLIKSEHFVNRINKA